MWDVITHPLVQQWFHNTDYEVKVSINNYIPFFYVNVITFSWSNHDAGLVNLC